MTDYEIIEKLKDRVAALEMSWTEFWMRYISDVERDYRQFLWYMNHAEEFPSDILEAVNEFLEEKNGR